MGKMDYDIAPEPDLIDDEQEDEDLSERLAAFVAELEKVADERVSRRSTVEARWIEDLQHYHGVYDNDTATRIKNAESSSVFVNITATKTDAMEARLWDLLFPTDDRNWGIAPTPVPEMTDQAEMALRALDKAKETANGAQTQMAAMQSANDMDAAGTAEAEMRAAEVVENEAQKASDELHERLNEAKDRSNLMQEEIADQMATCQYPTEARDAISDACKIGIGVLKGPVLGERQKQSWKRGDADEDGKESPFSLQSTADDMPAAYRVDPWGFYPDPDARTPVDSEGFYERHLMNAPQLRKLARRPDINKAAIRRLLKAKPSGSMPSFMAELDSLTGDASGQMKERFTVWEYSGPVDSDNMMLLARAFEDEDMLDDLEDADPIDEIHAKVWFCQGEVLSFAIHPLDSGDPIYSVFTIRRDETSMFGFGIPYIMRHPQEVLNGAYRMMMDNAGLGTGPQIVIDKSKVTPEDGNWTMKPRKVWNWTSDGMTEKSNPFQTFDIPMHQGELQAIIGLASQTIDEVTSMPAIAQGEQGAGVTKTAQGMALLMNSANVSFRRIVKNYDDDMTAPLIRRMYHWNMQFSAKEEIKGDYDVQARGSSVLLVREMQAQNLMMIAQMFGDHPIYGPMLKHGDLLRQIFKAHMISSDEIVKSDREVTKDVADQQEKPDPMAAVEQAKVDAMMREMELRREEMQHKGELANMEWDMRMKIAQMGHDSTMEAIAQKLNMSREQLDAKLQGQQMDADGKDRRMAVEVGMADKTGKSAGGAI